MNDKNEHGKKDVKKKNGPGIKNDPCQAKSQDALQQGVHFHLLGHQDKAIHWYRIALENQSENIIALSNLSTLLSDQGKFDEAVDSCKKAISISPDFADAHSNLGNALTRQGKLDEAVESYKTAISIKADFQDAHNNLGNALTRQGKLDEAVESYKTAISIKADFAAAYNNLGNALKKQGKLDEAAVSYKKAIFINSDFAGAHNNLGNVLTNQGRLDGAVDSFKKAISIDPDYADAHNNLGIVLINQGKLDEAISACSKAISIKADFPDAYSNLGIALINQGKLDEAISACSKAISIKADFPAAYNDLGNALKGQGKLDEAINCYKKAIFIKIDFPEAHCNLGNTLHDLGYHDEAFGSSLQALKLRESFEAKKLFVRSIATLGFTHVPDSVEEKLIRAISEAWTAPDELAPVAGQILKQQHRVGKCISRAVKAWPLRLNALELYGSTGTGEVFNDPLLRTLLESTLIPDIEVEQFLSMARHTLLEAALRSDEFEDKEENILGFYACLAQQCFINEYVFHLSETEIEQAKAIREMLSTALKNKTEIPILWPIAAASYFPLYSIPLADQLLEKDWPQFVTDLFVQQVREPGEEIKCRKTISLISEIDDEISVKVKNQYEENPYPRWIKSEQNKPLQVNEYFRQHFPLVSFKPLNEKAPDILIAGCGTGQHPIQTAQTFINSRISAIDLSLTSLGYAVRKTKELAISSIEYFQADILKLKIFDRKFDIIESSGVLHHLENPLKGWRILLSLLRPGGFMKVGLYSKLARRDIVQARSFIKNQGYKATAQDIRHCRKQIMETEYMPELKRIMNWSDFYSLSMCRDLLFHVQEHQFSLPDINTFLRDNNLVFLGFLLKSEVRHTYSQRFPDDPSGTNLEQWNIFEREHPDTFRGMFEFWIQKI